MSAHAIRFDPDGTATALWTEALPLADIGSLQVHRASEIEYNNFSEMWECRINGEMLCMSRSRQFCLDFEHAHINGLIATGKR